MREEIAAEIELPTPALGAHQQLAPIKGGRLGTVSLGELGQVRLNLMAAPSGLRD